MPIIGDMVELEGGAFAMGSADGRADEQPVHQVTVDGFAIGRFPVTVAEYAVFLETNGHPQPRDWMAPGFDDPRYPVCGVSWLDAVAYADWISNMTGACFHLPTEAQREWASLGGKSGIAYPWGDEPLPLEGVYARGLAGPLTGRPIPVGTGPAGPNGYGLWHLGDNVHEWCADFYQADYYADSPATNPVGPVDSDRRAARGGSWRHDIKFCRCAARSSLGPDKRFMDFGFRLARSDSFNYVNADE